MCIGFLKAGKECRGFNPAIRISSFGSGHRLKLRRPDERWCNLAQRFFIHALWRGPIEKLAALLFSETEASHQVTLPLIAGSTTAMRPLAPVINTFFSMVDYIDHRQTT